MIDESRGVRYGELATQLGENGDLSTLAIVNAIELLCREVGDLKAVVAKAVDLLDDIERNTT